MGQIQNRMRKQSAAYLEMLFEGRNKKYGGYELRTQYENRLLKSFGFALLIAGFFFLIPFVLAKIFTSHHVPDTTVATLCDLGPKITIEKHQPELPTHNHRQNIVSNTTTTY